MDDVWMMFGWCLDDFWWSLDEVWIMLGCCLDNIWMMLWYRHQVRAQEPATSTRNTSKKSESQEQNSKTPCVKNARVIECITQTWNCIRIVPFIASSFFTHGVPTFPLIYIYIYIYICNCLLLSLSLSLSMYIYILYIYIYIYIYIHMYIGMFIYSSSSIIIYIYICIYGSLYLHIYACYIHIHISVYIWYVITDIMIVMYSHCLTFCLYTWLSALCVSLSLSLSLSL